jgi:hypothetical protein
MTPEEAKEGTRGLLGLFGDWRELLVAWCLAMLGGLAKYAKTLSQGPVERIVYVQAGAKLFLAGFSGLLFYMLTADWTVGAHWKALCIALSGHMGGEAIEFVEGIMRDVIRRYAGSQNPPENK